MSHTNSTPNYNLPQFIGADKPSWLNDVNDALTAIDTQMKANAYSATTADTKATTANTSMGSLTNLATTAKTDIVSAVNDVNSKAGVAQETANSATSTATIANTNFEEWYLQNQDKSYRDFTFTFNEMSKSGPLFDLDKLLNISRNYISRLTKDEVYDDLLTWSNTYDKDFYDLIIKYKEYTKNILNIERQQKKPRKDYSSYSDIKDQVFYMYDELYDD